MTEKPFKYAKEFEGKIVNKLKKGTGGYAGKGLRADYVEIKDIQEIFDKIIAKERSEVYDELNKALNEYQQKVSDAIDDVINHHKNSNHIADKKLVLWYKALKTKLELE